MKFKHTLSHLLPLLFLVTVVASVIFTNLPPNGWLIGWDNLHTEFDFLLNIKRSIYSVWQEYQGLGLVGGMGHASDIFRELFLWLLSFFIEQKWLRYTYHALMVLSGVIGSYFFIYKVILKKESGWSRHIFSILGSLFYLFNLGTILYFYAPFEPYSTFWGLYPWLILTFCLYLEEKSLKRLAFLIIVNVFALAQSYVQTLFVVYFISLGIISLFYFLSHRNKSTLKGIILALGSVIIVNLIWILPSSYFLINNFNIHRNAQQIRLATDKFYLMNEGRGRVSDLLSMKLFYYDFTDYSIDTGSYDYLAKAWVDQFNRSDIEIAVYALWIFIILGIFYRSKHQLAVIAIFIITSLGFLSAEPFISDINKLLRVFPIVDQLFRNPYTKLIVPLVFTLSILFASGLVVIVRQFNRRLKPIMVSVLFVGILVIFTSVYLPVWRGEFIYKEMTNAIPDTYFNLFKFFKTQPKSGRIALLPVHSMWGWNYYSWGYRGSGFLWYGIEQPILDRAFDVWSDKNETFYDEFSQAMYSCSAQSTEDQLVKCRSDISSVLDKYDVSFVVLDGNIVSPEKDRIIGKELISNLFDGFGKSVFEEEGITVYKFEGQDNLYAVNKAIQTDYENTYLKSDEIYKSYGNYIDYNPKLSYPFSDTKMGEVSDISYKKLISGIDEVSFIREVKINKGDELVIPAMKVGQIIQVPVNVTLQDNSLKLVFRNPVGISVNNQNKEFIDWGIIHLPVDNNKGHYWLKIGKSLEPIFININEAVDTVAEVVVGEDVPILLYDQTPQKVVYKPDFNNAEPYICWEREGLVGEVGQTFDSDWKVITTQDASACQSFKVEPFVKDGMLEVNLPYKSISGVKPDFCITRDSEGEFCLNKEVYKNSDIGDGEGNIKRFAFLGSDKAHWIDLLVHAADRQGGKSVMAYQAPYVNFYPKVSESNILKDVWNKTLQESVLPIVSDTDKIKLVTTVLPQENNWLNATGSSLINCDILKRGKIHLDTEGRFISSDGGTTCSSLLMSDIFTDQEYILRFIGKNLSGRSMGVYAANQSNNMNDIDTVLNKNEIDQSFNIGGWMNLPKANYYVTVESPSYGEGSAVNMMDSLNVYPLPISWISKINIIHNDKNNDDSKEKITQAGNLNISNVDKFTFYQYGLDAKGEGVIALSQGFSNGWIAYIQEKDAIQSIFRGDRLEHFMLNSWANGWVVPEDKCKVSCKVVIVFWPQYLQFIGFGLLGVTFIVLIGFVLVDKVRNKTIK